LPCAIPFCTISVFTCSQKYLPNEFVTPKLFSVFIPLVYLAGNEPQLFCCPITNKVTIPTDLKSHKASETYHLSYNSQSILVRMNHKELMSEFLFRSGNFPAINVSQIIFQTEKLSKQQDRQCSYKNNI